MPYYTEIMRDSLFKRAKIKRDLIKILKRNGFKRSFFKHPSSEVYVKGDFKAKIYSGIERDSGSKEHGISPYNYGATRVKIDGPIMDSKFDRIKKELSAYFEKQEGESIKKSMQENSGLEKKFGVFVAFIIGGIALGLGSLTITGNAISNLTGTTPGLLGIILFIAGLVGILFYFRRK